MAIYTLDGTDKEIRVQGRYASVKNNGTETVYASSTPDLELNAADVVSIQAGESVIVRDCRKKLYVRGSGQIAVVSGNEPVNFFKPAPKGDGGGGDGITQQQLNDTLKTYATNTSVDDKLEDYAKKDEIPTSLPADGGNADTVGGKSAEELIQSNPNLLLNPDFKVNQRGLDTYTGIDYTVDRWQSISGGVITTVNTDGSISLLRDAAVSNNENSQISQLVGVLTGQTVTLSGCINDTIKHLTITVPESGTFSRSLNFYDSQDTLVATIILYGADVQKHVRFYVKCYSTTEAINVKWTKLELGAVATPFVPPNITEETLKCGPIDNPEQQVLYGNGVWGDISSNPNLLDNPDLKINQRGANTYNTRGYCVDRWRLYSLAGNSTVGTITPMSSGGVNIVSGGTKNDAYIIQYIENTEQLKEKTVTLSTKLEIVKGSVNIGQFGNDYASTKKYGITQSGVHSVTFVWRDSTTDSRNGIILWNGTQECEFNVEWVKLEIGSVATPFIPPNPAMELMKCQRYYWKSLPANNDYRSPCLISERWDDNTTMDYRCEIQPPVQMRVTPSLKVNGKSVGETVSLRHTATGRYVTGTLSATDIFSLTKDKLYRIGLTNPDKEVEINHHYEGTIELSADL